MDSTKSKKNKRKDRNISFAEAPVSAAASAFDDGSWTLVERKVRVKKHKTDEQLEAETQAYILETEQAFANRNQDMNDDEFNANLNNIGQKF